MTCIDIQRLMWDYVERQEINDDRFMHHVNSCIECKTMWHELNQFEQELQCLPISKPSPHFVNRVMREIETNNRWHRSRWSTWNHLWVASAATFAFFSFVSSWNPLSVTSVTSYVIRFGGFMLDATETVLQLF